MAGSAAIQRGCHRDGVKCVFMSLQNQDFELQPVSQQSFILCLLLCLLRPAVIRDCINIPIMV